jgi:hypothetical protein
MGKCAAKKMVRGYADGGEIDPEMQRKIDANKAKYNPQPKSSLFSGLFGSKPAQPQPQPPVQAQTGMIGAIQNRNEELKKAANYKNGGKIEGPGTPTSDSIEAEVEDDDDGEENETIKVSTKERILSHEQDMLVEALAKKMGFKSLDAMLEAGTGKPVGPTMKGGTAAAGNGAFINPNDPTPDQAAALARQQDEFAAQNKTDIVGKGLFARAFTNPNDLTQEQSAANAAMRTDFANENAGEIIGTQPVAYGYTPPESKAPSYGDDPAAAAPPGFAASPTTSTSTANPANGPNNMANAGGGGMAGSAPQVIRQGNSFTGTGPGIKEDMSKPLTSIDLNANNAGMAKANAIRQQMIDAQAGYRAEPGSSGGRISDSGRVEGDALLAKWGRETDAKNAMQMAAANPRAAQAIASTYGANVQGETALARDATDQMRNESNNATLRRGQDTRLQETGMQGDVARRGQDIGERTHLAQIAGNPVTNDLTRAQTGLAQAGLEDRKRNQAMIDEINNPATDPKRRELLHSSLQTALGKGTAERYLPIHQKNYEMGQVTGENVMVFDPSSKQFITPGGQQAAAAAPSGVKVPAGHTYAGTAGGKPVFRDAKGNLVQEGGK